MSHQGLPKFWMISVPEAGNAQSHLSRAVSGNASTHALKIPALRSGNLDDLMALSDDLEKTEGLVEKTCKKIGQTLFRLVEESQKNILVKQVLMVGNSSAQDFVTEFVWDEVKYPFMKQTCKEIASTITKDSGEFDDTFKRQMTEFSEIEHEITQLKKKESGNLMLRDLSAIVKPNDLVESEYLVTLLVVFPKHSESDWFKNYELLMPVPDAPQPPPIVPRSSVIIHRDEEFSLATVVVLKLVESEFKQAARQKRFIVREFSAPTGEDPQERLKTMMRRRDEIRADLIVWCRTTYTDIFSGWIHLKVIHLFVEAILRYGLPANNCNALLLVDPKKTKQLRAELGKLYKSLGSSMMRDDDIDETELATVGLTKKVYPYVYLPLDLSIE